MRRYAHRDDASRLVHLELGGTFAIREDAADGDGLTIEGVAVPYNVPTRAGATREFPGMREQVAPGAFAAVLAQRGDRPVAIIDEHDGTVVGSVQLIDTPTGLAYRGRLLTSQAARDFAERVRTGVLAPSIEFVIGQVRQVGDTVTHTAIAALGGIAATYKPAYAGSSFAVREEGNPNVNTCQHCNAELAEGALCNCAGAIGARAAVAAAATVSTDAQRAGVTGAAGFVLPTTEAIRRIAIEAADEVMRRNLEAGGGAGETDRYADIRAYRSLGELMYAAGQEGADRSILDYAARQLADQLTTDSNAGVTTPTSIQDVAGIVSRGRRAIAAFGGPRPLGDGPGMSFTWPYFDGTLTSLVGVQSTQKTEITSAKVEIKAGTEAIQTFAGGSDIAYQLIARSTPAYLDVYARIMLLAYAVVTDVAFVTELESGAVTGDFTEALASVDATELKGLLVDASVAVETATGAPAEFVLASTTAFKAAAKLFTPTPVSNANGTLDLRGLRVDIGGLPIIHVPSITAGKFIVSNREAAGWFEAGPFQATSEDVALLGRNVAYWGMGVPARMIPAGIIEVYDVTP